jgi:serine/threonine-protein kinase
MSEDAELRARSNARLGFTLRGKYRLDRVLGVGGMASVYVATHRNQKQFAVKMLHPELSIREDIRTRFVREGYAANSLHHPGAVAVLDDDVAEDGSAFLVMELLEGAEVEALWRSVAPVPLAASLAVIDQLLDVLAAAHAKGVVHRDIKPANLFLTHEGTLKVLDFGIARLRDAAGDRATHTGMLLGTPAFMAPEQALGQSSDIDGQTDIWAAGATLFTLITDRPVHEAINAQQIMIKAATTPARSLGSVAPQIHPSVIDVVDRALAFRKADRWPTAGAMREALRKAYVSVSGEEISKSQLARLFRGRDATQAAAAGVSAPTGPSPVTGPAGSAGGASNTPQPVSRSSPPASPSVAGTKPRPWVFGVAGAGALGLAVLAGFELHGQGPGPANAASPAASSAVAAAVAPPVEHAPAAIDSAPPSAVLAPPATLTTPPALAASVASAPAPPSIAGAAPPRTPPAGATPVASHPAGARPASASPPGGGKNNCNPPYVIDAAGHRNYKPECL